MKKTIACMALAVLAAGSARAGIHYKARTYQEGANANKQLEMLVEGWIDGDNAKILFLESGNPFMKKGNYLLTTDGGRMLYLVDPEKKTYSEWDLGAILSMANSVMQGPMLNVSIENPQVVTELEEDGGDMFGFSTTHYRFRTTYDLKMKIMGMKRAQHHESVREMWATDDVDDGAFGVWLTQDSKSGDGAFDELVKAEMSKVKGFALKTVEEVVTTNKKGKQQTTRTITRVEQADEVDVDPEIYRLSDDLQQTQMMPTAAAGGEEGQGGLGALLGGRRGKGGGGG